MALVNSPCMSGTIVVILALFYAFCYLAYNFSFPFRAQDAASTPGGCSSKIFKDILTETADQCVLY